MRHTPATTAPRSVHPTTGRCVAGPRGQRGSQLPHPKPGQLVERVRSHPAGAQNIHGLGVIRRRLAPYRSARSRVRVTGGRTAGIDLTGAAVGGVVVNTLGPPSAMWLGWGAGRHRVACRAARSHLDDTHIFTAAACGGGPRVRVSPEATHQRVAGSRFLTVPKISITASSRTT